VAVVYTIVLLGASGLRFERGGFDAWAGRGERERGRGRGLCYFLATRLLSILLFYEPCLFFDVAALPIAAALLLYNLYLLPASQPSTRLFMFFSLGIPSSLLHGGLWCVGLAGCWLASQLSIGVEPFIYGYPNWWEEMPYADVGTMSWYLMLVRKGERGR